MIGLVLSNEWEKMWEEEIMTLFSYYTRVFLAVPTKTNVLFRIAGLWNQTCPRDLCNKKQCKETCAPCLTHDQYARQSDINELIKCKTFEISGKIKYVENQNNTRLSLSRIRSKKFKADGISYHPFYPQPHI